MAFSESDLDHIIRLAHLSVDPGLKDTYLRQLQDVLGYMEQLNQLDLNEFEISHDDVESPSVLREDRVNDSEPLPLEKNAPKWDEQAFEVPRILGGDT